MSTQATPGEKAPTKNVDEEFALYPLYKVVSVFEDSSKIDAAIDELQEHNFTADDIESYCGVDGEKTIDFDGTRHGVWASFARAVQKVGPERTYLERYERHLKEGHCVIMVAVRNKERKETAGRILNKHTPERVTYFGLLAADEIKP
jgi:hypothetical protein